MIFVPGRKDRGVILTTVTELPPDERLERSERERPSGSGLQRSKDETVGLERAGREVQRRVTSEDNKRRGGEKRQTGMEIPEHTQKQWKNNKQIWTLKQKTKM